MICLLLCFRLKKETSFAERYTYITDFGFDDEGWLNLDFSSPPMNTSFLNRTIVVLSVKSDELQSFKKVIETNIPDCSKHYTGYNSTIITNTGSGSANMSIKEKSVYHIYIIPCQTGFSSRFSVDLSMKNSDSWLDYRDKLGLLFQPIFIGLENMVVMIWLVKAFYNHRACSGVYVVLTIIHFLYLVYLSFDYLQLYKSHTGDSTEKYELFKHFETASTSLLFVFLIIAGSGWGLCRDIELFRDLGSAVLLVMIYLITPILVNVLSLDYFWVIFFGLQILSIALLIRLLFRCTAEARLRVLAHLYAIDDKGIDSLQTPVYMKYKMFIHLRIVGILALIVIPIMNLTIFRRGWFINSIVTSVYLGILWYITWLYRSRGKTADSLFAADSDPDYARKSIKIGNLRAIEKNRDTFGLDMCRDYTEGMALPNAPKIILGIVGTGTLLSMESSYGNY